jgi:hypothetical protein
MALDALSFLGGIGAGLALGFGVPKVLAARRAGAALATAAADEGPRGPECLICGRPLPIGGKDCPSCKPSAPPPDALGQTIEGAYKPLDEIVPLTGLSRTAQQVREVGAKGYLHVFTGPNKGESILLGRGPVTIGRATQNLLVLNDDNVSQKHAEVVPKAGGYYVRDLGSRNGTFVNDLRVENEKRLAAGDVVAVGGTKMLFQG